MTIVKAIVLAGGLGTRLQPYTTFLPKPMLPLGEKPIAEHLVDWIRKNGIKSVVFCVSYLRKSIEDYFEDGARFGVNVEYAISNRPLATAGQLKTAQGLVNDSFVCMYGDSIYDFNLKSMIRLHQKKKSMVTMGLYEYMTHLPYGVIETGSTGRVKRWNEKPEIKATINMGCYVMEPEIFGLIPKNRPYGMDSVIKKIIPKKSVSAYIARKGFVDIGNKAAYKKANQDYLNKLGDI